MIKTILVGLDGNVRSRAATQLAIDWARQTEALVIGIGIVDEPTISRPQAVPPGAAHFKHEAEVSQLHQARHDVERFLSEFETACRDAGVSHKLLEQTGSPAECLLRAAQRYDILMVGKKTHFAFATQREPCDTLATLLRQCPRPIVAVPQQVPTGDSVLIAYDGSVQSSRAVQLAALSGLLDQKRVEVLTVDADRLVAAKSADHIIEFLDFHGYKAQPRPIASSTAPASVILAEAQKLAPSLLVMGAYGKPTWKEFFLGTNTQTLLQSSPSPLFLYH